MRLVDIEPLFDKYDKMNEGTEFSPIHFMNDLAALPVVESCENCIRREDVVRILDWSKASVQMLDDYSADELVGEIITIEKEVENLLSVKPQTVTDFTDKCKECGKILNEKNQQKWIPVSEREPDEDYETNGIQYSDDVLVTLKRKRPVNDEGIVDFARTNDGKWFSQLSRIYIPDDWEVVAWMPLPEPYKAESEGEG